MTVAPPIPNKASLLITIFLTFNKYKLLAKFSCFDLVPVLFIFMVSSHAVGYTPSTTPTTSRFAFIPILTYTIVELPRNMATSQEKSSAVEPKRRTIGTVIFPSFIYFAYLKMHLTTTKSTNNSPSRRQAVVPIDKVNLILLINYTIVFVLFFDIYFVYENFFLSVSTVQVFSHSSEEILYLCNTPRDH